MYASPFVMIPKSSQSPLHASHDNTLNGILSISLPHWQGYT